MMNFEVWLLRQGEAKTVCRTPIHKLAQVILHDECDRLQGEGWKVLEETPTHIILQRRHWFRTRRAMLWIKAL